MRTSVQSGGCGGGGDDDDDDNKWEIALHVL
jgi:hypothetical protein